MRRIALQTGSRDGTIGWLAERVYTEGGVEALADLATVLDRVADRRGFAEQAILKPEDGVDLADTILDERDNSIAYRAYDPPPLWGAPYSVLRIEVSRGQAGEMMHHTGDEIVRPIDGALNFDFLHARPGEAPGIVGRHEVSPSTVFRINSQIPHRVWVSGGAPTAAWLVVRDRSNSPAAIQAARTEGSDKYTPPAMRHFDPENLQSYAEFGMRAWGLMDHIRAYRMSAELSSAQLAGLCKLDRAQLSKIEAGSVNAGLGTLMRILTMLRIPLQQLIANSAWYCAQSDISATEPGAHFSELTTSGSSLPEPMTHWPLRHHLHAYHLVMGKGEQRLEKMPDNPDLRFLTIIPYRGEVAVSSAGPDNPGGARDLVGVGSVAHLRRMEQVSMQALDDADLFIVGCSVSAAR